MLWNSSLVLPTWMPSPRSSFLVLAELADSPLSTSFLWLEDKSVILSPLLRKCCWVLVVVAHQFPDAG